MDANNVHLETSGTTGEERSGIDARSGLVDSGSSSANVHSDPVVDDLATGASRTAGKEMRQVEALRELEKNIRKLAEFVVDKNNVHKAIKSYAKSILRCFELANPSVVGVGDKGKVDVGSQTSSQSMAVGQKANHNMPKKDLAKRRQKGQPPNKDEELKGRKESKSAVQVPPQPREPLCESPEPATSETVENGWQKRENRRRKGKKRKPRATRPDALVLKAKEGSTYADILRTLKSDPDLQDLGSNVSKIRKNAAGNLVLVLQRKAGEKAGELQSAVAGKLASKAEVLRKTEHMAIELRDLDELTEATDVLQAISAHLDNTTEAGETAVKSLRKAYGGTQTAVVVLPADKARSLLEVGSVKVGWVISRVRAKVLPLRCFKCLGFGHTAKTCSGPDRSKACFRCGLEGHTSRNCAADPRCLLCGEGGKHATGSFACPVYRQAAKEASSRVRR